MKRLRLGLLLGVVAGLIDVVPMLIQNLTWDANLSAFSLWVVSGFLIGSSNLKVSGALKGLLVPVLVLVPCAILIGWKSPESLIPITIMTALLGSALGFLVDKFGE